MCWAGRVPEGVLKILETCMKCIAGETSESQHNSNLLLLGKIVKFFC
jgi:hypothetical protein